MKIGELSTLAATSVESIRYYEREGLIASPPRTQGNFRVYEAAHLARLQFIRHCRSLDMSLSEVRVLLRVKDDPNADCGDVNALLDAHIGHVASRMKELRFLERQLTELRERCSDLQSSRQCGILAGILEASADAPLQTSEGHHLRSAHVR